MNRHNSGAQNSPHSTCGPNWKGSNCDGPVRFTMTLAKVTSVCLCFFLHFFARTQVMLDVCVPLSHA
jgi:hypothetical protein